MKPEVEELKIVNELAKDLKLSSSEIDGGDDDDAGTSDQGRGSDPIDLD